MTKSLTLSIVLCGCAFLHFFSISKIDRVFQYRSTSTVKTSTDPPPVGLLQLKKWVKVRRQKRRKISD
ncbi:hypothetical protein E1A91_D01G123400v1 [Gossypium mustelinum]|uniref:Uncharacterized protein n=1 Tax=Gossypium mustelinum TaxID=34275 RepID=A0A5D2W669_GOSMU|nr:hypothetical protein E1A91_D01G123400v1 [Gossypium mustelinum]